MAIFSDFSAMQPTMLDHTDICNEAKPVSKISYYCHKVSPIIWALQMFPCLSVSCLICSQVYQVCSLESLEFFESSVSVSWPSLPSLGVLDGEVAPSPGRTKPPVRFGNDAPRGRIQLQHRENRNRHHGHLSTVHWIHWILLQMLHLDMP